MSYDWRTGRWASPPAPGRPWPGDPGQLPVQKGALSPPEQTGRLKGLDQMGIAPTVWPTANPNSSSALPAQAPGAWPLPGNGILSGWTPVSAAGGKGILSGAVSGWCLARAGQRDARRAGLGTGWTFGFG
jgi:hypothetical protein